MTRLVISDPDHPLAGPLAARAGAWTVGTDWVGADVALVLTDPDGEFGERSWGHQHPVGIALQRASEAGVRRAVVFSSATVYGAWPTNSIPITEETPVRPVPGFGPGFYWAEGERLLDDWVRADAGRSGAVLRSAPVISLATHPLMRALWRADIRPVADVAEWSAPPWQSLTVDDLVDAALAVAGSSVSGPVNVAPDGWIDGSKVASFGGVGLGLAGRVVGPLARVATRLTRAAPPPVMAYVLYPFVVANDRLREVGWEPAHTNEEALVAARPETPAGRMFGRYRQELSLLGVATAAGLVVAGLAAVVRRRRR